MIKYLMLALFSLTIFVSSMSAQEKYWVMLTDKDGVSFDPHVYFDQKAIDRRIKQGISLMDETDFPIRTDYFSQVNELSDTISGHSRWFNALACIVSSEEQIIAIRNLECVKDVVLMLSEAVFAGESNVLKKDKSKEQDKDFMESQIAWMQGQKFTDANIDGTGVRVCIIDAGFPNVDISKQFAHIRKRNGIVATWDFHKNKPDVYKFNSHGATVLSCIGGRYDGQDIGMATGAEFLLARTERIFVEGLSEEEDWMMAIEWADKNGADIVNSSLGYTVSLYFKEDMDGKTSLISRAGNLAARKGILVVNAAGNEGAGSWKYVAAPADADSVLTIGGINPWTGIHTSFSSYGPTADKRRKPNVAAYGHVVAYSKYGNVGETQGTSFASPLTAGFAACVLQKDSTLKVMELFKQIEASANMYPYFDYAHGYGVPQASYFMDTLEFDEAAESKFDFEIGPKFITVNICDASFVLNEEVVVNYNYYFTFGKPKHFHKQDQFSTLDSKPLSNQPNYVYYHIENEKGYLKEYSTVAPTQKDVLKIRIHTNVDNVLRVWYRGEFKELLIEKEVKEEELEEVEEQTIEKSIDETLDEKELPIEKDKKLLEKERVEKENTLKNNKKEQDED
ncbi:MAG: serine protease AprX [Flavobacteriales bacterium]|jgi:serine protease AprX